MGSVKDLHIVDKPTERTVGFGWFDFTNDYSVFDWGKMPDTIPGKGASLCMTSAYFFELFKKAGIETHYRYLGTPSGEFTFTTDAKEPASKMYVKLVRVIEPKFSEEDGGKKRVYDYSVFTPNLVNFLIPLEVIYRNGLPVGSSVFKRLKCDEMTPGDLGLDHYPQENEMLPKPLLDLSTKLEKGDKYPTWKQRWEWAKMITGMNDAEIREMQDRMYVSSRIISEESAKTGLIDWDGKLEFAYDPFRKLIVVDAVGTLDECRKTTKMPRFTLFSKEAGRQYYKKTQPEWVADIDAAKARAEKEGVEEWKQFVTTEPRPMNQNLLTIISWMYQSFTNELLGRRIFDTLTIAETEREYLKYLELMK